MSGFSLIITMGLQPQFDGDRAGDFAGNLSPNDLAEGAYCVEYDRATPVLGPRNYWIKGLAGNSLKLAGADGVWL